MIHINAVSSDVTDDYNDYEKKQTQEISSALNATFSKLLSEEGRANAAESLSGMPPLTINPYRPPKGAIYKEQLTLMGVVDWGPLYSHHGFNNIEELMCFDRDPASGKSTTNKIDEEVIYSANGEMKERLFQRLMVWLKRAPNPTRDKCDIVGHTRDPSQRPAPPDMQQTVSPLSCVRVPVRRKSSQKSALMTDIQRQRKNDIL
eukprot:Tbor_TRINITY_DN5529_c1_g9::TRINITY_DN5529_c1_g9_i1::g.12953::m.12953